FARAQGPHRASGQGRRGDLLRGAVLRRAAGVRRPPLWLCRAHGRGDPRRRAPAGRALETVMGRAIEELAHFVASTPWETIPEAVREHAKLVLLDTVGVILAGSVQR